MKREVWTLALRVAVPLTLLAVAPTQAATKISSFGYVITAPGTYNVTQDMSGSGNAITVLASNVDLHLGNHTLSGDGFSGAGVDVEGGTNVSIDHGTVQGFYDGILLNSALGCKVSSVTASRNSNYGIALSLGSGHSVTDSTVTQSGDRGIDLYGSNGNTLTHNTVASNNNPGISVSDTSFGNTVAHNSCTGNGYGILVWITANQNTVQDNAVSNNHFGILVLDGSSRNTVQNNTANLNVVGIQIAQDCTGNKIQSNTALTNGNVDLEDDNLNCDSNTWANNKFATDLVAGVPDGGPGAGCIR